MGGGELCEVGKECPQKEGSEQLLCVFSMKMNLEAKQVPAVLDQLPQCVGCP